jgi:transcription termination/antitermination protein NusG
MLAVKHLHEIGPYVVGQIHDHIATEHMKELIEDIRRRWHVLLIEPQRELTAAAYLTAHRFKVYLPQIKTWARRGLRRTKMEVERPMFPGYLFIRFDPDLDDGKRRWRIDITPGVRGFMKLDGEHAIISDVDIRVVQMIEEEERSGLRRPEIVHGYRLGEEVRVSEGVFSGFNGQVSRLDDEQRITLLLSLFGRAVRATLPVDDIEKL